MEVRGPLVLVKPMGQGLRQPGTRFVSSPSQQPPRGRTFLPLQMESLRLRAGSRLFSRIPPPPHLQRLRREGPPAGRGNASLPTAWLRASLKPLRVTWVDVLRSVQDLGTSTGCGVSERHQRQGGSGPQNPDPSVQAGCGRGLLGVGVTSTEPLSCHLSRMTSAAPHTHPAPVWTTSQA